MSSRKSIVDALEMLINDSVLGHKLTNKQKTLKIKTWHIGLRNISDGDIYKGLEKAMDNDKKGFLLSCGQFKELCTTVKGVNSTETEALEAWDLVMSNLNYYTSPIFYNSVIAESIRKMGGWKKLCSMLIKDEPYRKMDFIALYGMLKSRNLQYKPKLIGFDEDYIKFIGFENVTEKEKNYILKQSQNNESIESNMMDIIKLSRISEKNHA